MGQNAQDNRKSTVTDSICQDNNIYRQVMSVRCVCVCVCLCVCVCVCVVCVCVWRGGSERRVRHICHVTSGAWVEVGGLDCGWGHMTHDPLTVINVAGGGT